MKKAISYTITCGVGRLLACLVLLHWIIVAPLLVECIRSDGSVVFEMAGDDPCHESWMVAMGARRAGGTPQSALADSTCYPDPCLDLSVYRPGTAIAEAVFTPTPDFAFCENPYESPKGSEEGTSGAILKPPWEAGFSSPTTLHYSPLRI